MTESQEQLFARWTLEQVQQMAMCTDVKEDRGAATVAILVQAIILATPDLSAERRAGLFLENEE